MGVLCLLTGIVWVGVFAFSGIMYRLGKKSELKFDATDDIEEIELTEIAQYITNDCNSIRRKHGGWSGCRKVV